MYGTSAVNINICPYHNLKSILGKQLELYKNRCVMYNCYIKPCEKHTFFRNMRKDDTI